MENQIQPINRRSLLQRGMVLIGGLLGLDRIEPRSYAQGPSAPPLPEGGGPKLPLRFYVRGWQSCSCGHEPGALPTRSERLNRHGELFATPAGQRIGEFQSTSFCQPGSFGLHPGPGLALELHTFKVGQETLFGMGSRSAGSAGPQLHAIVGGTGRFAGARGSYLVNPMAGTSGGADVEVILTIVS